MEYQKLVILTEEIRHQVSDFLEIRQLQSWGGIEDLEGRGPKDQGDYPRAGAGGEGERDGGREAGSRSHGGAGWTRKAGGSDRLPRRGGEDHREGAEDLRVLFRELESGR